MRKVVVAAAIAFAMPSVGHASEIDEERKPEAQFVADCAASNGPLDNDDCANVIKIAIGAIAVYKKTTGFAAACIPEDVTVEQMRPEILKWMTDHPDPKPDMKAGPAILPALHAIYPCK